MHAPLGKTATPKHLAAAVRWRWHNLGIKIEKHVHTTLTLEPEHASQKLQCEPWRNGQPFPRGQRWRLLAEARPQPSTCKERHTRKGPTGRGMYPERYLAYPHAKRISPPRIEKKTGCCPCGRATNSSFQKLRWPSKDIEDMTRMWQIPATEHDMRNRLPR